MSRPLRTALAASLLLLAGTGEDAWAKPKLTGAARPAARAHLPAPRTSAAEAGLRGQLAPDVKSAPTTAAAAPTLPDLAAPRPQALRRLGQGEGSFVSAGLIGLRSRADASPLCRSTCAQARYQCAAGDGATNCDTTWGRCVLSCRTPLTP